VQARFHCKRDVFASSQLSGPILFTFLEKMSALVAMIVTFLLAGVSHAFVTPNGAVTSTSATARHVLPPEQGVPVLAGMLAYPSFLIYRSLSGGGAASGGDDGQASKKEDGALEDEGSIGRVLKWSKMQKENPTSPPYVRMCVGQDCTKDGAVDAWEMVRDMAPKGVSILPVNCLGPCGKGPCGEAYALDPDPNRRCPLKLDDGDGFFDEGAAAPSPGVLPSGLVMARVAEGRRRLANGFISTEIKTTADARVLFRGMGFSDGELCGGRGYDASGGPREVTSTRAGLFDLNRLDNILLQRICYAGLFVFFSDRFELDGGADVALAEGIPPVPLWVLGLAFFGATQVISVNPDDNTYRPPRADLESPMPYAGGE